MSDLSRLRAEVFEIAGDQCEWPGHVFAGRCTYPARELAHITPRGMGGGKSRNILSNVFAACDIHARVSDFVPPFGAGWQTIQREWQLIPGCSEFFVNARTSQSKWVGTLREELRFWVNKRRRSEGVETGWNPNVTTV